MVCPCCATEEGGSRLYSELNSSSLRLSCRASTTEDSSLTRSPPAPLTPPDVSKGRPRSGHVPAAAADMLQYWSRVAVGKGGGATVAKNKHKKGGKNWEKSSVGVFTKAQQSGKNWNKSSVDVFTKAQQFGKNLRIEFNLNELNLIKVELQKNWREKSDALGKGELTIRFAQNSTIRQKLMKNLPSS